MKRITICLLVIFLSVPLFSKNFSLQEAINIGSTEICKKIDGSINTVVIVDVQSDYENLSDYIYTELNYSFVTNLKKTAVAERNEFALSLIKKELDYQNSGEVSDTTIQSVGNSLGADCLVLGKIEDVSSGWNFTLKAVQVETKTILSVWRGVILKNDKDVKYITSKKTTKDLENNIKSDIENEEESSTVIQKEPSSLSGGSMIQDKKTDLNNSDWLFPLYGVELGKTTEKEMKKLGGERDKNKKLSFIYTLNGVEFIRNNTYKESYNYDPKTFNTMYIRKGQVIPKWEKMGYSLSLSYNEWFDFLQSQGYEIKVTYIPHVEYNRNKEPTFTAEISAFRGSPVKHVISLYFGNYYKEKATNLSSADDKNTLCDFSISIVTNKNWKWELVQDKTADYELLLKEAPIKSSGWHWNNNGWSPNYGDVTFFDVSEAYSEKTGVISVDGKNVRYWLYNTNYLGFEDLKDKYLAYWINKLGYSIITPRQTNVYEPVKNLQQSIKNLMEEAYSSVAVAILNEESGEPTLFITYWPKTFNREDKYMTIKCPLIKNK